MNSFSAADLTDWQLFIIFVLSSIFPHKCRLDVFPILSISHNSVNLLSPNPHISISLSHILGQSILDLGLERKFHDWMPFLAPTLQLFLQPEISGMSPINNNNT